ncbi:hypothetical protein, partial [Laceyella putida]
WRLTDFYGIKIGSFPKWVQLKHDVLDHATKGPINVIVSIPKWVQLKPRTNPLFGLPNKFPFQNGCN